MASTTSNILKSTRTFKLVQDNEKSTPTSSDPSSTGDPSPSDEPSPPSPSDEEIWKDDEEGKDEKVEGDSTTVTELSGQRIRPDEEPTEPCWKLIPLFKEDSHGRMRIWQIGFDPDSQRLITIHGIVDGKIQMTHKAVTTNSSGRSLLEQALLEARSDYKKHYDKGSRPLVESVNLPQELEFSSPMLANEYNPSKIKRFPVLAQAKLDGVRGQLTCEPGPEGDPSRVKCRSRENRTQLHTSGHLLPHREELVNFFKFLPPKAELDGEWYSHEISFNRLRSVMATKKIVHPDTKLVKFYIFDIKEPQVLTYLDRYNLLVEAMEKYVKAGYSAKYFCILASRFVNSHDEISKLHDKYVEMGYEGLILRKIALPGMSEKELKETIYRPVRCNNILKVKEFITEEGEIVGVEEGKGKYEGTAILRIKDKRGDILTVNPRGSLELRREWFEHPEQVIGKRYTFRYFKPAEEGDKPRFPTGIALRDYE